jgi:hypothetical protein
MPRKEFEAFTRLDASDVNTFLMDQSVMSFAGTAARGSAIATPVEGMAAYLQDSNILSIYDGAAWKTSLATTGSVLQVVTATTTTQTATTATLVNTALSVTITPKSASNKILVTSYNQGLLHNNAAGLSLMTIKRNISSDVSLDVRADLYFATNNSGILVPATLGILDSPNTTSAVTYGTQVGSSNVANTATVRDRQIIIAMEIAA